MPFSYVKKLPCRIGATVKAVLRTLKLFVIGLFLQGKTRNLQSGSHVFLFNCAVSQWYNTVIVPIKSFEYPKLMSWYRVVMKNPSFLSTNVFTSPKLPGGYFHGINNLTYGVDIEQMRLMGILQVSLLSLYCYCHSCQWKSNSISLLVFYPFFFLPFL